MSLSSGYLAAVSSEMLVAFYQTTRRHIPNDISFHTYCRENLKYHLELYWFAQLIGIREILVSNLGPGIGFQLLSLMSFQ
jgi:hypothetical protein